MLLFDESTTMEKPTRKTHKEIHVTSIRRIEPMTELEAVCLHHWNNHDAPRSTV